MAIVDFVVVHWWSCQTDHLKLIDNVWDCPLVAVILDTSAMPSEPHASLVRSQITWLLFYNPLVQVVTRIVGNSKKEKKVVLVAALSSVVSGWVSSLWAKSSGLSPASLSLTTDCPPPPNLPKWCPTKTCGTAALCIPPPGRTASTVYVVVPFADSKS